MGAMIQTFKATTVVGRLLEAAEEAKVSVSELGRLAGSKNGYQLVRNWTHLGKKPQYQTVVKAARGLGYAPEQIIGGAEDAADYGGAGVAEPAPVAAREARVVPDAGSSAEDAERWLDMYLDACGFAEGTPRYDEVRGRVLRASASRAACDCWAAMPSGTITQTPASASQSTNRPSFSSLSMSTEAPSV